MNLNKIKDDCLEIIQKSNLKLYSFDYKKKDDSNVLEIVVDKVGFIDIEDIEDITNKINEYLDKEDPIDEEYSLEISSRGLEKDFDFDDASVYIGEWIEVKTFDQLYKGKLIEALKDSLVIKNDKNKNIKINANDISSLRIVCKF